MGSDYLRKLDYPSCMLSFPSVCLVSDSLSMITSDSDKAAELSIPAEASKMTVNQQHLKQAWDVTSISTRDDWIDWLQRLSIELMKESSSHALRACRDLVETHPPLAKELFNAAFISCWGELYDQYQVSIVHSFTSES